jgi:acetyl esterase/lipase
MLPPAFPATVGIHVRDCREDREMTGRTVRAGLLALLAGGVGTAIARRRRTLAPIPAELRHRALLVPLSIRGAVSLRAARMVGRASVVADRVVAERRPVTVAGESVDVVVYTPQNRTVPSGALLWIHGGGLVIGRAEQDHALCSGLAAELGIVVVSVDYRLAPEHPFPAAPDDCCAALSWLHAASPDLGVDRSRIAVGGASAGAGLAAAVCQRARDDAEVAVALQLLVYPMLDDRTVLRPDHERRGIIWTAASNRYGWTSYLGHPPAPDEPRPYAVPARRADLAGLPPAWIGVGDRDLFFDEDVEYARRLQAAGVPCTLDVEPGMYHGADIITPDAPSMQAFRARMVQALGAAVSAPVGAGPPTAR